MCKSIQHKHPLFSGQFQLGRRIFLAILFGGIFMLFTTVNLHAANSVKPLSGKVLKKIEGTYGKDTRELFRGKGSEKNVLALKRLIAEEIDPDIAVLAIEKYNELKKYRPASAERKNAWEFIKQLFAKTRLSWKKGRDIIIGAASAVVARKTKTAQRTYTANNKARCKSKKTVTERAAKIKYEDGDKFAEQVILHELNGETSTPSIKNELPDIQAEH